MSARERTEILHVLTTREVTLCSTVITITTYLSWQIQNIRSSVIPAILFSSVNDEPRILHLPYNRLRVECNESYELILASIIQGPLQHANVFLRCEDSARAGMTTVTRFTFFAETRFHPTCDDLDRTGRLLVVKHNSVNGALDGEMSVDEIDAVFRFVTGGST